MRVFRVYQGRPIVVGTFRPSANLLRGSMFRVVKAQRVSLRRGPVFSDDLGTVDVETFLLDHLTIEGVMERAVRLKNGQDPIHLPDFRYGDEEEARQAAPAQGSARDVERALALAKQRIVELIQDIEAKGWSINQISNRLSMIDREITLTMWTGCEEQHVAGLLAEAMRRAERRHLKALLDEERQRVAADQAMRDGAWKRGARKRLLKL